MNYKNILVVENDIKDIPLVLKNILKGVTEPIDYWYNFNYSFYHSAEENFKRLSELKDTLIIANPSFVGADNQFDRYIILFLKLKEQNIKLNFAVLYPENFYTYLLKYLSSEDRFPKKIQLHKMLQELLDYHNIYEIIEGKKIEDAKHITYDYLLENYIETNRHNPDKIRVLATGRIYDAYSIYYSDKLEDTTLSLKIPDDFNNEFKLNEIEKI